MDRLIAWIRDNSRQPAWAPSASRDEKQMAYLLKSLKMYPMALARHPRLGELEILLGLYGDDPAFSFEKSWSEHAARKREMTASYRAEKEKRQMQRRAPDSK
jgi:hypothetical protein